MEILNIPILVMLIAATVYISQIITPPQKATFRVSFCGLYHCDKGNRHAYHHARALLWALCRWKVADSVWGYRCFTFLDRIWLWSERIIQKAWIGRLLEEKNSKSVVAVRNYHSDCRSIQLEIVE